MLISKSVIMTLVSGRSAEGIYSTRVLSSIRQLVIKEMQESGASILLRVISELRQGIATGETLT